MLDVPYRVIKAISLHSLTNFIDSLAKNLQDFSAEFRQKQRKYLSDVQAQKSGAAAETESKFGIDLNETAREYGRTQFNFQRTCGVGD